MQEVMEPILQIQVLGKFTLRYGETVISDEDDRSRKVWAVLAYLIYHREKIISQQELVDLCWGEDTRSSDPHNALKSVIHRIRATLDKLQEGLGRTGKRSTPGSPRRQAPGGPGADAAAPKGRLLHLEHRRSSGGGRRGL